MSDINKISDIRMMLIALWNTVANNDRKKVRKKLYEIEKMENLSDKEKEKFMRILLNL